VQLPPFGDYAFGELERVQHYALTWQRGVHLDFAARSA
jgi:hypothetical protein